MPVGTQGAVKGVTHRDLEALGAEILLSNTYHLYLRPGDDLIARRGGLHRFIGWTKPILTDSGGYQVFSLAGAPHDRRGGRALPLAPRRLGASADAGEGRRHPGAARIRHRDGARRVPRAIRPTTRRRAQSMERTLRWARARARRAFSRCAPAPVAGVIVTNPGQAQFGIVQGGVFPELREESARGTVAIGFEALRDRRAERRRADRRDVRHRGADDAVPARRSAALSDGRRHAARTWSSRSRAASTCSTACCRPGTPGTASSSPAKGASTSRTRGTPRTTGRPIRPAAATPAGPVRAPICGICFMAGEINAATLNTLHNLHFYLDTLRRIRDAIAFGRFESFRLEFHQRLSRQLHDS